MEGDKHMKKLKDTKGITIIALTITIVVLVILVGVTLGALQGDKGLIKEANQGKAQAEEKSERELLDLAIIAAMQKDTFGKVIKENLDTELDKEPGSFLKDLINDLEEKLIVDKLVNTKEALTEYITNNYK